MKLFGGKKGGGHLSREETPPERETRAAGTATAAKDSARKRLRTPLLIVCCAIAVALAAVAAHAIFVRPPATRDDGLNTPGAIHPAVSERPIATPPPDSLPPEETEEPLEARQASGYRKETSYTFVLLASDQVSGGTDTILAGRLDTEAGTLDLVNIPRDTLVNVSWPVKKANTIYVDEHEDPDRFIARLSGLLGFGVDHYAVMNLKAVERIVDAMGGVDYNMPRNMDYDDPTQDLSIHIAAGQQHLSGADVVKALRFREGNDGTGYPDGDLGRINFQHGLLKSVASQFLTLGNIPNLPKVIDVFEENVKTDLTTGNLTFYAEQFLLMDKENIRFHMAPGEAIGIRGGSYYELDVSAWVDMLNETLNPYTVPVAESNLDVLHYLGGEGAVSTTGDMLPLSSFYDFYSYSG